MDYYIDITVLPDPEFKTTILTSALYSKLHRALVAVGKGEIGVSFPRAGKTPGELLRLHAGRSVLERLMEQNWLKGLKDYSSVSAINPVPSTVQYIQVKRAQPKKTAARLRRAIKRGSISEQEAKTIFAEKQLLKKPFFQFQSLSTGQRFPLFIDQGKPQAETVKGEFTSYGLSDKATVPWF
jgi:CRISPR-associated endonuclease Csy4